MTTIGTKKAAIRSMLIAYIILSRIILTSNIFFLPRYNSSKSY